MSIVENIALIKARIHNACEKCGRNPAEVKLLMATKTVDPERIKQAFQTGETLMGENKVQELRDKFDALQNIAHTKHFIGHLQTNKIKDILKCNVACIQSVDRFDAAEKLQQRLELEDKTIEILVQVNTSYEDSKFGVDPNQTLSLVKKISALDRIKIKGLMTIGILSEDTVKIRQCFQTLKQLQQQIIAENIPNVDCQELSMGMSGDLEIAIEEGATIIRVGSAIFGQRTQRA